jgi:hypothetical protein
MTVIRRTLELDKSYPWLRSTGLINRVDPFVRLLFDPFDPGRDNRSLLAELYGLGPDRVAGELLPVYTFVGAVIIPGYPTVDVHYFTQLCP